MSVTGDRLLVIAANKLMADMLVNAVLYFSESREQDRRHLLELLRYRMCPECHRHFKTFLEGMEAHTALHRSAAEPHLRPTANEPYR